MNEKLKEILWAVIGSVLMNVLIFGAFMQIRPL